MTLKNFSFCRLIFFIRVFAQQQKPAVHVVQDTSKFLPFFLLESFRSQFYCKCLASSDKVVASSTAFCYKEFAVNMYHPFRKDDLSTFSEGIVR